MKVKILFCLFFCFGLGASAQVIDIYITNQLNDSDKIIVQFYDYNFMIKKKSILNLINNKIEKIKRNRY